MQFNDSNFLYSSSSSSTSALHNLNPKHNLSEELGSTIPFSLELLDSMIPLTPEENAILQGVEKYLTLSPFKMDSNANSNIITRIWNAFINFLKKIFFIENSNENSPEETQLLLAANLFKTYDPKIVSTSEKLPLSIALEAYYHTIKNVDGHFNLSEDKVESLRLSVDYSKEIESISKCCSLYRNVRLKKLTEQIKDRINNLKNDESIFLPGGFAQYSKEVLKGTLENLSDLLPQSFNSIHMIYEIKKNPADPSKILFRVINSSSEADQLIDSKWGIISALNGLNIPLSNELLLNHVDVNTKRLKGSSEILFNLPAKEFTENIQTLLEVQVTPHEAYNMHWLEKVYYFIVQFVKKLFCSCATPAEEDTISQITYSTKNQNIDYNLIKNSLPVFVKDLSSVKFYSVFQKFNAIGIKESKKITKLKTQPNAIKITKLFSEYLLNHQEPLQEITLKVALFWSVFNYYKPRLNELHIRQWVKDNLYSLKEYLEKIWVNNDIINPKLKQCFSNVIKDINNNNQPKLFKLPHTTQDLKTCTSEFDSIILKEKIRPLDSFVEIDPNRPRVSRKTVPPETEVCKPELFAKKLKYCEKLSREKNLTELQYHVRETFEVLNDLDIIHYWDNLNPNEIEQWSGYIHQLCGFMPQVQFGLNLTCPTPLEISNILKALRISVKLAQKNDASTGFGSYSLEMNAFRDILKDEYLNLEGEGPEIRKTINQIACRDKVLLKLTDPNSLDTLPAPDKQFFEAYQAKFKKELKGYHHLEEDFNPGKGKLNIQVIYIRRLKMLAMGLMATYRTIGNPSNFFALKNSFITFFNSFTRSKQTLEIEYVKRICQEIQDSISNTQTPEDFFTEGYFLQKGKYVRMNPYLCHIDYDDPIIKDIGSPFTSKIIPSQYQGLEQQVSPIFASKILESAVCNGDQGAFIEEGYKIQPNESNEYTLQQKVSHVPRGECHSERYIVEESETEFGLPRDKWTELRLTKTAPLGTRIPNTLEFFERNPNFLGSYRFTPSLQRIFYLNLFRNNGLGDFLTLRPDYASRMISQLISLYAKLESSNNVEGMLFVIQLFTKVRYVLEKLSEDSEGPIRTTYDEQIACLLKISTDKHFKKLSQWIDDLELKSNPTDSNALLIYKTFLLLSQDLETSNNELNYLKTWFKMRQIPQNPDSYNYMADDKINYKLYKSLPGCEKILQNEQIRVSFLVELAGEMGFYTKPDHWQVLDDPLCFKNNELTFDLKKGLVFVNGEAISHLPDLLMQNPKYKSIFNNDNNVPIWCKYKKIRWEESEGYLGNFEVNEQKFAVLILNGQNPILYKQFKSNVEGSFEWYQLSETGASPKKTNEATSTLEELDSPVRSPHNLSKSKFPNTIIQNTLWISCKSSKFIVENKNHQSLFEGQFSEEKIVDGQVQRNIKSLKLSKEGDKVLNPWDRSVFKHFLALGAPSEIIASGTNENSIQSIKYLNHSIEYKWNEDKWECNKYPGYYLSEQPIELFLSGYANLNDLNGISFFSPQFKYYHILEHPTQKPKLILPCQEYVSFNSTLQKNNRNFQKGQFSILEKTYYEYTIENGELKSTPEGYLYLAYILFTHSNYAKAFFYLTKAQQINPETSLECQQILTWFSNRKVSTLNAKIFMLHVYMHVLNRSPQLMKTDHFDKAQKNLLINFLKACSEYDFTKPLPFLRLTLREYRQIVDYIEFIEAKKNEFIHLGSKGTIDEIEQKLHTSLDDLIVKFIPSSSFSNNEERVSQQKGNLDTSISRLTGSYNMDYKYEWKPTRIFSSLQKFLSTSNETLENKDETQQIISQLKNRFNNNSTFSDKLANDLIADIDVAQQQFNAKKVSIQESNFNEIKKTLENDIFQLKNDVRTYRNNITKYIKTNTSSFWNDLETDLVHTLTSNPLEFNDILHAAANQELSANEINANYRVSLKSNRNEDFTYFDSSDFTNFSEPAISENETQELKSQIKRYLESLTLLQQHQKALNLLYNCINTQPPSKTLVNALVELLSVERVYDCHKDPHAIAILLLEATLEIIARKSQMENFSLMITRDNVVKKEPLAGGKTTFLRNLISKLKDNKKLSCVITYDPLIPLHHKQLEFANSEAYGDKVYRFEFNLNQRTDAITLKIIQNHLLACIEEHARIDFTPQDILSLHHSLILKYDDLQKTKSDTTNDELNILIEIINIFKTQAKVTSDEFDKILEANKQHNYGLGAPHKLNSDSCEIACCFVEWILSNPKYCEIFQQSDIHLWKYSDNSEFIDDLKSYISQKFVDTICNENEKKQVFSYLLSDKKKNFNDSSLTASQINKINACHTLLHKILPTSFKWRNGLNYIRSKDGFQVKPVISNGKCNELSEFGTEEEIIWYTCLNYMNSNNKKTTGGVTLKQIEQLIIDLKNDTANALAKQLKENPHEYALFKNTSLATEFYNSFGVELDTVTPAMYPKLAEKINSHPKLLANFLSKYVFPLSDKRLEQIIGTPQHLIPMFESFSGSSGTSNIFRSLPDNLSIAESEAGVDGAIFYHLIRTFSPEDLIKYNDQEDIFQQTLNHLKEGDALIDCAPIFPGMTAEDIAHSFSPLLPEKSYIRYTNEQDQEVVRDNSTDSTVPEYLGSIDKAITIIEKSQTRGTNKELPYQSCGLLTINAMTTLTEFQQSIMRMRKFGKGQKVRLFVDEKTYSILAPKTADASKFKLEFMVNLINLLSYNESEFLKNQHHIKSEVQKIETIGENLIFDTLLCNLKRKENRLSVWKNCRDYFIKPTDNKVKAHDPSSSKETEETFSQLCELAKVKNNSLEIFKKNIQAKYVIVGDDRKFLDLFLESTERAQRRLTEIQKGNELLDVMFLPSNYFKDSSSLNMNNLVQKNQSVKVDREIELELDIEKEFDNLPKPKIIFDWKTIWDINEIPNFENLLSKLQKRSSESSIMPLRKYAKFYDKNLFFTHNLFKPQNKNNDDNLPELLPWTDNSPEKPLPPGQTRLIKMAIIVDRNNDTSIGAYGILGTLKDFDNIFYKMYNPALKKDKVDFYIYNLTTDELESNQWVQKYPINIQKKIAKLIVQAKHLAGETELLNLDSKNQNNPFIAHQDKMFELWLQKIHVSHLANIVDLEKNLRKYLRTMKPSAERLYPSSSMAKIYKKCKERECINLRISNSPNGKDISLDFLKKYQED